MVWQVQIIEPFAVRLRRTLPLNFNLLIISTDNAPSLSIRTQFLAKLICSSLSNTTNRITKKKRIIFREPFGEQSDARAYLRGAILHGKRVERSRIDDPESCYRSRPRLSRRGVRELFDQVPREIPAFSANFRQSACAITSTRLFLFFFLFPGASSTIAVGRFFVLNRFLPQ
jgi:hypothetical protein